MKTLQLNLKIPAVAMVATFLVCYACNSGTPGAGSAPSDPAETPDSAGELVPGNFAPPGAAELRYPARVAPAEDGSMWVTDPSSNAAFELVDGTVVTVLAGLDQPIGIALQGNRLYVGNKGRGTVELYDIETRTFLSSLGRGVGEFSMPNDIALGADGTVFVADSVEDTVKVYDKNGSPSASIGSRGAKDGEFRFPSAVAFDGDRLVVADQGNHRIQIFNPAGEFQLAFGQEVPASVTSLEQFKGGFTRVQAVAVAGAHTYVLDSYHGHVQMFDAKGQSQGFLGRKGKCQECVALALDIAIDSSGGLLVTDPERRRVVSLNGFGEVTP